MHDGHAGAHGPLADDELSAARDQCCVPDLDAGDVSDGIEWSGGSAEQGADAKLSRPGFGALR